MCESAASVPSPFAQQRLFHPVPSFTHPNADICGDDGQREDTRRESCTNQLLAERAVQKIGSRHTSSCQVHPSLFVRPTLLRKQRGRHQHSNARFMTPREGVIASSSTGPISAFVRPFPSAFLSVCMNGEQTSRRMEHSHHVRIEVGQQASDVGSGCQNEQLTRIDLFRHDLQYRRSVDRACSEFSVQRMDPHSPLEERRRECRRCLLWRPFAMRLMIRRIAVALTHFSAFLFVLGLSQSSLVVFFFLLDIYVISISFFNSLS
ncbi:hypothetical protein BLNAU_12367 [Blattamonas nauphoetae]|uniref:Transmembrane protein n=1 Tax=Blattamonas nauphoetae TaxID=2049346 RepID=A0ABQ9XJW4_9EUKA|nr:hypothetical protein BLNAU_12367 [Blattamonas nauphoetae]